MIKTRFLLLLLGLTLAPAAWGREPVWKVRTAAFFRIHYQGDSRIAEQVRQVSEQHWMEIRRYVPVRSEELIPIYIYPRRDQFLKALGEKQESQIIGIAYSPSSVIRIDGSQLYAFLGPLLGHELVHVALSQALGSKVSELPLWFNEGLARHEEGGVSLADQELLSDAVTDRALIPLSALEESFPKEPRAGGLAYAEGASVVDYLIREHGSEALFVIIQKMQDGTPFAQALYETTGLTRQELEREWLGSLKTTHRWDWLYTMYTPIVSAIMVLLCIAAWFAVQHRRRRIMRRFDEEEFNDFLSR